MRTNDEKENLLHRMSRTRSIKHTVCPDIHVPGDNFVIEVNGPNQFGEKVCQLRTHDMVII